MLNPSNNLKPPGQQEQARPIYTCRRRALLCRPFSAAAAVLPGVQRCQPPAVPLASLCARSPYPTMVSFSCEVSLYPLASLSLSPTPALARALTPTFTPAPRPSEADYNPLELWRCPHKEEARRPPQPMLRRILHLPRLHDPLPRHQLQVPHGMRLSSLPCACCHLLSSLLRQTLSRIFHSSYPTPADPTISLVSPRTKSTRASSTRKRSQRASPSTTTTTTTTITTTTTTTTRRH
jgi:hypothetical protein